VLVFLLLFFYTVSIQGDSQTEGVMEAGANQPNQQPMARVPQGMPHRGYPSPQEGGGRRPRRRVIVGGSVLLVLVVIGIFWSWWLFGRNTSFNENQNINTHEFQAIFLTNGQVYFGKLANLNNKYVTIHDVYYLQVQQNSSLQGASSTTTPNSQVSLVKLGNELHGPEDKMYIASGQMLFWENMKDSSKVVQAIDKYQNQ
jgi:hypothetical protein